MNHTLPVPTRRRGALAVALALVVALLAFGAPLSASADVVGDGPATISGTVTTSDGQPLQGVLVNTLIGFGQGTAFSASTFSDANGAYEFTGLAADTYFVSANAYGYQRPAGQYATVSVESPATTVDFIVEPFVVGVGTITGHVTADGVPVPDAYVSIYSETTSQNLSAQTDETGAFEFAGLANGTWSISAYLGSEYQLLLNPSATLSDSNSSATADLAFLSWPTGTATISGVVTDSQTGTAIPGASVSAFGVDVAHNSYQITDETGSFSFTLLPEGTFSLNFFAFGYLIATKDVQAVSDATTAADQALIPADAAISGHIKSKDGAPIAGIYVNANAAGGNFGWAETDENGDYVITDLGAVSYTLTVGGVGTPYTAKGKTITAATDGSATANFTLKDRTRGSFGGYVLDAAGEYYDAPVCVTLYSSKNTRAVAEVTTYGPDYGDGTYTFDRLKPGSYTAKFTDCDADPAKAFDTAYLGGSSTYAGATFVTIAAAEDSQDNTFSVTPRATTSSITGHVEKPNGTAIAGLTVFVTDGIASSASAVTDANGNYTVAGLFTDSYSVTVGGGTTLYKEKHKTVTTVADGSVTANFTLPKQ